MTVIRRGDFVASTLQSMSWRQLAITALGSYIVYKILSPVYAFWKNNRSPLRKLPGPSTGGNFLFGHTLAAFKDESNNLQRGWVRDYGETFVIRGMLGNYQLITTDTRANTHILFASHIYQKPSFERAIITGFLGEGLLSTEGEQHRDQRRILNPAFGFSHIRDMTEIFLDKSALLREVLTNKCIDAGGTARIDVLDWLSKATLDIIGKAGFDYEFDTLNENGAMDELAKAFDEVLRKDASKWDQIRMLVNYQFPVIRAIAPGSSERASEFGKKKMNEIGMRIIQEKKQAILEEMGGGRIEKKAVGGKDLISLLLQANLAADLQPSQRLSDREVLAQIPSFLVAGHETTSNTTTWAMYSLATNPKTQKKLRAELLEVTTENPTLDMLNALPYLDYVTRETLRIHNALGQSTREATQDDIIPLGTPIQDRSGNLVSSIKVNKGDQVHVPIFLVNHSKEIWGPDADEFRPERWENVPSEASTIPGITPNLMTFIGGPRGCIGHRFAVAEIKALLFHMVRGFEFSLAVDPSEVYSKSGGIARPQLRKDNSVQLPIYITPVA
ncbi:cytochrome P450 [Auricularia subglabra TFB-10046 SS5]|uniref:Cytochrome P450 n=1 Tax=Auricularia subglabra (strain TFB-10046 / SS5) TaxID=717982 RepID=J0WWC9_AURST|nr:cytochrome P450 [Auricularia subglabra TFB-10046 SS5]